MNIKIIFLLLFSGLYLISCNKDKAPAIDTAPIVDCDTIPASFNVDVRPIFLSNCATVNCHNSTSNAGGYTTETYSQIEANNNLFLTSMKHGAGVIAMPFFSPKLPDSLIQKVECWIADGSPNN